VDGVHEDAEEVVEAVRGVWEQPLLEALGFATAGVEVQDVLAVATGHNARNENVLHSGIEIVFGIIEHSWCKAICEKWRRLSLKSNPYVESFKTLESGTRRRTCAAF
jgi:hypothetical protein